MKRFRSDSSGPAEPARPSIFTRLAGKVSLPKSRQVPGFDNFTIWDRAENQGRNGMPVYFDSSAHLSLRRDALSAVENNPFGVTMLAQQGWARRRDLADESGEIMLSGASEVQPLNEGQSRYRYGSGLHSSGGRPRRFNGDLDWSRIRTKAQLWEQLDSSMPDHQPVDGPSPADSAIALLEDEVSSSGNGEGLAMPRPPRIGSHKVDQVLVEVQVLHQDMELKLQRAKELQLQRREEDFRTNADDFEEGEDRMVAGLAEPKECVCCGDSKTQLDFPARRSTSSCEHTSQTCSECMQSWMASEFESKGCEGIKCPECPSKLSYHDVQRAASEETFSAYEKLITRSALTSLEEFSWCLKANCGSGQLNAENDNFMECVSCGYQQCLEHRVPWHTKETCEQYEYRTSGQKARDEERATEVMLDAVSKKCPGKKCGWRIEKIDGCAHMRCKKCRHEFCWECLASHKEIKKIGNTAHYIGCSFHSANLETSWPFNVHD